MRLSLVHCYVLVQRKGGITPPTLKWLIPYHSRGRGNGRDLTPTVKLKTEALDGLFTWAGHHAGSERAASSKAVTGQGMSWSSRAALLYTATT